MDHGHNRTFRAKRVFTDREEPIARFQQALGKPQSREQHRVLVWYGVGGQGKSSLCRKMQQQLEGQGGVAIASLDFEIPEDRQPVWALLKLRGDLKKTGGLSFPTFDLACLRYLSLHNPGKDIRALYPELYRRGESEIANDLLDWSEEGIKEFGQELAKDAALLIPGFNLLYKYGSRLTGKLREWWDSREVKDHLQALDGYERAELAEQLPVYLGFDLWRAQAESDCPRIVLTVDTHEKLWGEGGAEGAGINLRVDQWLRDLVAKSPGVLWLVFGRDRLRWSELDPDWDEVLEQDPPLGGLSNNDADWYLQQASIDDPVIRERIIQGAEGLPFYLDLSVKQYETMLSKGQAPSRDAFGTTPTEIIQRFLQYLGADEKRDLLLASYLERVNEKLFHSLAETFLGGAAMVNLVQLKRRSLLEEDAQGHLTLHALMRQALQDQEKNERAELFECIHRFLFKHFDQKAAVKSARDIDEHCVTALLEALPHAIALGTDEFGTWLFERVEHYSAAAEYHLLQYMFEKSLFVFAEDTWQYANSATWLAGTHLKRAQTDLAEMMYHKALAIYRSLGHQKGILIAYGNLGTVYNMRGQLDQAEAMYHKALEINKALGYQEGMADLYGNLGNVHLKRMQWGQAKAMYFKALDISETLENQQDISTAYYNLGIMYHARGKLDQAEVMYHRALEISERNRYPKSMANQCSNLGNLYRDRGDKSEARRYWEFARDLSAAIDSPKAQIIQNWIDNLDTSSE